MIHLRSNALPSLFYQPAETTGASDPQALAQGLLNFLDPESGRVVGPGQLPQPGGHLGKSFPGGPSVPRQELPEDLPADLLALLGGASVPTDPTVGVLPVNSASGDEVLLPAMFPSRGRGASGGQQIPAVNPDPRSLAGRANGNLDMGSIPNARTNLATSPNPTRAEALALFAQRGGNALSPGQSLETSLARAHHALRTNAPAAPAVSNRFAAPRADQSRTFNGVAPTPAEGIETPTQPERPTAPTEALSESRRVASQPTTPSASLPAPESNEVRPSAELRADNRTNPLTSQSSSAPGRQTAPPPGIAIAQTAPGAERRLANREGRVSPAAAKEAGGKAHGLGLATPELSETLKRIAEPLRGASLVMPSEHGGSATSGAANGAASAAPEFTLNADTADADAEFFRLAALSEDRGIGKSLPARAGKVFHPRGVVDQVSSMVQHLFVGRVSARSMSVMLNPPALGRVQIDVVEQSERDSRVQIVLRADRPETERLLQQHLQDLRQSLEQGGVDLGSLVLEESGNRFANSESHDDSAQPTPRQSPPTEEEPAAPRHLFGRPRGTGRLSVIA